MSTLLHSSSMLHSSIPLLWHYSSNTWCSFVNHVLQFLTDSHEVSFELDTVSLEEKAYFLKYILYNVTTCLFVSRRLILYSAFYIPHKSTASMTNRSKQVCFKTVSKMYAAQRKRQQYINITGDFQDGPVHDGLIFLLYAGGVPTTVALQQEASVVLLKYIPIFWLVGYSLSSTVKALKCIWWIFINFNFTNCKLVHLDFRITNNVCDCLLILNYFNNNGWHSTFFNMNVFTSVKQPWVHKLWEVLQKALY